MVWVELHVGSSYRGPRNITLPMASFRDNLGSGPSFFTEDDIPGSSLNGRDTNRFKNSELKFWLKCRGDSCNGVRHLQTADLQTCRLADLQTCRLADLQTFVTSANHVTLDNNIVTRS